MFWPLKLFDQKNEVKLINCFTAAVNKNHPGRHDETKRGSEPKDDVANYILITQTWCEATTSEASAKQRLAK